MKKTSKFEKLYLAFFAIALLIEIILARSQNQRYLVPFITFLIIPSAIFFSHLWKGVHVKKFITAFLIIIPGIISILLIYNPDLYIIQSSKISKLSDVAYIHGQTSGYGITEAVEFIKNSSSASLPNMVLFGLNLGNPENAINLYSSLDKRLYGMRIDRAFFQDLDQFDCLNSDYPVFFVTRDDQLLGMDRYFTELKTFPNPYGDYAIKIYSLKNNCKGRSASLSSFYQNAIKSIDEIRSDNII